MQVISVFCNILEFERFNFCSHLDHLVSGLIFIILSKILNTAITFAISFNFCFHFAYYIKLSSL